MNQGGHANSPVVEVVDSLQAPLKDMSSFDGEKGGQSSPISCRAPDFPGREAMDHLSLAFGNNLVISVQNGIGVGSGVATKGESGGVARKSQCVDPAPSHAVQVQHALEGVIEPGPGVGLIELSLQAPPMNEKMRMAIEYQGIIVKVCRPF